MDIDRSKEAFVIEDARYLDASLYPDTVYELNITVRNIGPIDCRLTSLYLNATDILGEVNVPSLDDGAYHILISDKANSTRARVTFMFTDAPASIPINEGDTVNIIVTTERGTKANYLWEVSP